MLPIRTEKNQIHSSDASYSSCLSARRRLESVLLFQQQQQLVGAKETKLSVTSPP
jgi:hypothetical protein